MKEIKKCGIIGLGALGTMYGKHILDHGGAQELNIIVDESRKARYRKEGIFSNGEACSFSYSTITGNPEPLDLILVAVKFNSLKQAINDMSPFVGPDTVIMSLLNGISSEEILGERFGMERVIYCVALGMDAVKMGNSLTYANMGILKFGCYDEEEKKIELVERVAAYFQKRKVPHVVDNAMKKQLWSKFMLNVGVNQTAMVYETNYKGLQNSGEARNTMLAAMGEVMELSRMEGVDLTREDLENWMVVLATLDPEGMPSMRQDGLRKQKSEVELFAGTVLKLGRKHGVAVPVNKFLYEKILEIESNFH